MAGKVERSGTREVEQEPKWNEPGRAGPPPGISVKGQSGTSGTQSGFLVPGLVPPKINAKVPRNPYL